MTRKSLASLSVMGIVVLGACTGASNNPSTAPATSSATSSQAIASTMPPAPAPAASSASKSTAVKDEGFSRGCAKDEDCVLAMFGDTCGFCNHSNAAIAKSAQNSWQDAYNVAHGNCPIDPAVGKCRQQVAVSKCEKKTCTLVDCGDKSAKDEHHCGAK